MLRRRRRPRRRRRHVRARHRRATCRWSAPTPPSSSGRSRTCSRTPRATRRGAAGRGARARGRRPLLVRVVDRGPGHPAGRAGAVFEPFYRGAAPSRRPRGSGLGLAIVRGFVEANGGRVWVESLPGQGTSFVVELPCRSEPVAPCRRRARDERPRVLVVDDEPQILRALQGRAARRRLRARSPAATARGGARRAPRCARRTPRSSTSCCPTATASRSAGGCASGARCRSSCSRPSATRTQKVRALEAGADDYVTKPFGPRELVARLQRGAAPRAATAGRAGDRASTAWRSTSPRASSAATARRST